MASVDDFIGWVARDLGKWAAFEQSVQVHPSDDDGTRRYSVFTATNEYVIRVRPKSDGDNGYLGCTSRSRTPRAGETWRRGNDLADGDFCEETWKKILADIVSYELVRISRQVEQASV